MAKEKTDWESMEVEYAKGIYSNCQLAREYEVSEGAVRKRAKQYGWVKNLTEKIKAKARAIEYEQLGTSTIGNRTEALLVETVAKKQVEISTEQKKTIDKYKSLGVSLYDELVAQTINKQDFIALGEIIKEQPDMDRLIPLFRKVISTPSRIDSYKKLMEAFKTSIGLERQAYAMTDNGDDDQPKEITRIELVPYVSRSN